MLLTVDKSIDDVTPELVTQTKAGLASIFGKTCGCNFSPDLIIIEVIPGSVILKVTVLSSPDMVIEGPADTKVQDDLLESFESGALQKALPAIPIAHVDEEVEATLDGTVEFYWTDWYNTDSPSVNGSDAEELHAILRTHDVCKGGAPLGVNCHTSDGVAWSMTGQKFVTPCGLSGIVCDNNDNLPDGCLDYMVQFYCAPADQYTMSPRLYTRHVKIAIEQIPDALLSSGDTGLGLSLFQEMFLKSTLPPVQPIAVPAWGGEAAMDGRGKCDPGADSCPVACGGACTCKAGWGGDDCSKFMLRMSAIGGSTDERGTDGELIQVKVGASIQPCKHLGTPCEVVCDVSISNDKELRFVVDGAQSLLSSTKVTISGKFFDEATGGSTGPAGLAGFKDFVDDGDQKSELQVGPCTSTDPRYNGIPKNMLPSATSLTLINKHISFPIVSEISPDIVHMSTGRQITVQGKRLLQNSTVLYGNTTVSDWSTGAKAYTWRKYNHTGRWLPYPMTVNESHVFDKVFDSSLAFEKVLITHEISALFHNSSASKPANLETAQATTAAFDRRSLDSFEVGTEEPADKVLLRMFKNTGRFDRTMCTMLEEAGKDADLSGMFNFSWVSDTEITFYTPCETTLPVTNWPKKGDTYRGLHIINPDGLESPTAMDVRRGYVPVAEQSKSLVYVTDKRIEPGAILLGGRCQPCPVGAECPGGGRVWPLPG